jgi:hypothetical protein
MKITRPPIYPELNPAQLVSRIKWEWGGESPQELYGRYVKYRMLKPDIDMKEFVRLYGIVVPKSYDKIMEFDYKPTHKTVWGVEVMVLPETQRWSGLVDIVLEYGGYGTEYLRNLKPIDLGGDEQ